VRVTGEDRDKKRATKSAVERPDYGATPAMPQEHPVDERGGVVDDGPTLQASSRCDPAGDAGVALRRRR